MTQEQLQYIIDSDLPNYKKSQMIKDLYDLEHKDVTMFQKGGNLTEDQKAGREPVEIDGKQYYINGDGETIPVEYLEEHPEKKGEQIGKEDEVHPSETISVGNKTYNVQIAESEEEKEVGLSKIKELPEDCGMLFVYDSPQEDLWFTMEDTAVDLDIIFINEDLEVTSVNSVKAFDPQPIPDVAGNAQFVLEVNINSGIKKGDEMESPLTDEDKENIKNSKMLVLDSNGDVQMKLEGGERIVSRIKTRQLIKAALKAYKSDNDSDYKRVGRIILKELNAQDSRDAEYVEK